MYLTSAVRLCRTIPSGAFPHQFSAPNQYRSQSIEDADLVQRQGITISMRRLRVSLISVSQFWGSLQTRPGNSENCCPLTESVPACISNSLRNLCRENPKNEIWDLKCRLAKVVVASVGRRRRDTRRREGADSLGISAAIAGSSPHPSFVWLRMYPRTADARTGLERIHLRWAH